MLRHLTCQPTRLLCLLAWTCLHPPTTVAETPFPCEDATLVRHTAFRTLTALKIDGRLNEPIWEQAPLSRRYVDLISGGPTRHGTYAQIVWDDTHLYLGIRVEEPFVHAKFTEVNSPIYEDNDIEVFIAGADAYYEFELNAFNTPYEVFFIWEKSWETAEFSKKPEFARDLLRPFNGVGFTTHPRGPRLGHFQWHFPGKRTAVFVDGTVNDDKDRDRGWTVELAFPWAGMKALATDGRALPPKNGDVWRIDFSRFNTYKEAAPAQDSGGWALNAHGAWDSHIPECFPYVLFSTNAPPLSQQARSPHPLP